MNRAKIALFFFAFCLFAVGARAVTIERELQYDQYTLADSYMYGKALRRIQWDKISAKLDTFELFQQKNCSWGILRNYKNINGTVPVVKEPKQDPYGLIDKYGVERTQSAPLYLPEEMAAPERYGRDGSLVVVKDSADGYFAVQVAAYSGEWRVPQKFVRRIDSVAVFTKVIFVDRANQNIVALEKVGDKWLARSVNPATTGLRKPPHMRETPLGIFVIQEKRFKMFYYDDGTTTIGGFSPYASRFSNGGYVHGVPVNLPATNMIEYSQSLGTTPRSHMCVRNATSHAKFIYDWAEPERIIIFVIE